MAIKIGFYGAECYDLLQYVSRVLKSFKYKVLMIDQSVDKGLESTIPIPEGLKKDIGVVLDYRGIDYTDRYMKAYSKYYDYIIVYYGRGVQRLLKTDWMFVVDDGDVRTTKNIHEVMNMMPVILADSKATRKEDGYNPVEPVCIALGPIAKNVSFSKYPVSKDNIETVEMDMDDILFKYHCQLNNVFKFDKISSGYHDLLFKIIISILEKKYTSKEIKKVFKNAERGK